jgi:hypothetical protein
MISRVLIFDGLGLTKITIHSVSLSTRGLTKSHNGHIVAIYSLLNHVFQVIFIKSMGTHGIFVNPIEGEDLFAYRLLDLILVEHLPMFVAIELLARGSRAIVGIYRL